ncbi:beta-ureidopropionase [Coprothermobacteraceae bacterium]|nr:beta-ureidopropionase [Coprothermobacteraceae bacterium]
MRVGYVQFKPKFGDKEYNTKRMMELASTLDADVIVFPELANTGYVFKTQEEVNDLAETAEGPTVMAMKDFAKEKGSLLTFGFAERDGDSVYNSAATVTPEGNVYIYRKVHLFNREKLFFESGSEFFTFEWRGVTFGMMICFDWMFPESMRTLALMGAQVILHPANLVLPYCQNAMVTRCLENMVFEVTANRIGTERGLKFTGMSQITAPRGVILHRGTKTTEEAVAVEINPDLAQNKKINDFNDVLADRNPRAYRLG